MPSFSLVKLTKINEQSAIITSYAIGDAALNDVVNTYTSNLARMGDKNGTIYFKEKRAPCDSIAVNALSLRIKVDILSYVFWREDHQEGIRPVPNKLEYNTRLIIKY